MFGFIVFIQFLHLSYWQCRVKYTPQLRNSLIKKKNPNNPALTLFKWTAIDYTDETLHIH